VRRVLYQIDRFGYLDGKQKHEVTPQYPEGNGAIIEKKTWVKPAGSRIFARGSVFAGLAFDSCCAIELFQNRS